MRPICVIPARGGSKRLPRKNVALLGGRPMMEWTIDAARVSGIFERVYVSTEDEEIAEVARRAGAEVPGLRPIELAGDLVTNVAVCRELLERVDGSDDDALICLQPSSPLRSGADVREAWHRFAADEAEFLVSVTAVDPHYFHWAVKKTDQGWALALGDRFLAVRQDLPAVYRPNGAIKIARAGTLARHGNFFGEKLTVHEMAEDRSVHVATDFDLVLAEALIQRRLAA